jgi:FKBP-type peptidyl-prolyl cis-trans isomerase FkpA
MIDSRRPGAADSHSPALSSPLATLVACGLVALALGTAACSRQAAPPLAASAGRVSALEKRDVVVGTGAEAMAGAKVTVHYTGWLYDQTKPDQKGEQFDSSRTGGQPFEFALGAGQVIAGWDQGVQGMKVGGQRRLVIPAALAYGDSGAGGVIPPGATLMFDVELLDVAAPGS